MPGQGLDIAGTASQKSGSDQAILSSITQFEIRRILRSALTWLEYNGWGLYAGVQGCRMLTEQICTTYMDQELGWDGQGADSVLTEHFCDEQVALLERRTGGRSDSHMYTYSLWNTENTTDYCRYTTVCTEYRALTYTTDMLAFTLSLQLHAKLSALGARMTSFEASIGFLWPCSRRGGQA